MKLDHKNIVNNPANIGNIYFICDYRHTDPNKKAERHVKPTKVQAVDNTGYEEAGKKYPRFYYSEFALVPVTDSGKLSYSKNIAPFDTTGYRSFTGIPVNYFDNMEECVEFYNNQVQVVADMIQRELESVVPILVKKREEILELKILIK